MLPQLATTPHLRSTHRCSVSVPIIVLQQCPRVNPGSSDVTATSTTAATPSRRLLQSSTENIGLNITLPAGTNISQAIATLTAASGNGTGTLLTAAQQAYVLLSSSRTRLPGPAVIPMPIALGCCHPHAHSLGLLSAPCTQPGPAIIPIHTAWACCHPQAHSLGLLSSPCTQPGPAAAVHSCHACLMLPAVILLVGTGLIQTALCTLLTQVHSHLTCHLTAVHHRWNG